MIKYIIDKGVDLKIETEYRSLRQIHFSYKYSAPSCIQDIIDNGIDLEAELQKGWRRITICEFNTEYQF